MSNMFSFSFGIPGDVQTAPIGVVKKPLLKPESIRVADEGELVHITVGNSTLTMDYEGALRLSQMIRVHAKKSKRTAGDVSRHWSGIAMLDDLKE